MKHDTFLFWTCRCERHPYHRRHESQCAHCGDLRDKVFAIQSNIAELLQWHSEFLTSNEISAFERVGNPHDNEIWTLIESDGGIYPVAVSKSMLEVEEEYIRRAIAAGVQWDEKAMDYDWSSCNTSYAVIGFDTVIVEAI